MPGIWTWRGSSSTAGSGWVAADAAHQPMASSSTRQKTIPRLRERRRLERKQNSLR